MDCNISAYLRFYIYFVINIFHYKQFTSSKFIFDNFLIKNKVLNLINYISEIREKLADGKVAAARVFDIVAYKFLAKKIMGQ